MDAFDARQVRLMAIVSAIIATAFPMLTSAIDTPHQLGELPLLLRFK